jgi:hypothetical protein
MPVSLTFQIPHRDHFGRHPLKPGTVAHESILVASLGRASSYHLAPSSRRNLPLPRVPVRPKPGDLHRIRVRSCRSVRLALRSDHGQMILMPRFWLVYSASELQFVVDHTWQNKNRVFPVQGRSVYVPAVRSALHRHDRENLARPCYPA